MGSRAGKNQQVALTAEEVAAATERLMAGAQAHQRAAAWCLDKPDAKPPNINAVFFPVVSFELVLLSIEQSLRLLLLLRYSIVRDNTDHNPHVLYGEIRAKSGGKEGIRDGIVSTMNMLGQTKDIDPFSEKEMVACLKRHDSSYSSFRYFQLDRRARVSSPLESSPRDVQILHCLALALISLNMDEMGRRGINVMASLSRVPESEVTEELEAVRSRLTGSTRADKGA